jgi:hypothetical protein
VGRFRRLLGQNLTAKQALTCKLAEVLAFCCEHRLDVLLVKGVALDLLVYGPHAFTTSQDIDLVLRAKAAELGPAERAAIASVTRGYPLEYDYYEHHDITLNGALPVNFDRIWRDAIGVRFEGQPAWVMCPEDLLITACINACRKRFSRLKALCDIAEILQTYPNLDWRGVARRARADQCQAIVYAALAAADMFLNARLPAGALDLLAVAPARTAVIRFLVQRMPSYAWTAPQAGVQIFNRRVSLSLLLPYMTYGWDQVRRKLRFVWHSRNTASAGANGR